MIKKYRTQIREIEAIQFTGQNYRECERFLEYNYDNTKRYPNVRTKEGEIIQVNIWDFLIKKGKDDYISLSPISFYDDYMEY